MYRNNLKKLLVIYLAIQLVYIYGYDKEAEDYGETKKIEIADMSVEINEDYA